MKPVINKEACIGCGSCEGIAPEVFKLNDGKAEVIALDDYAPLKEKIDQAVTSCPTQCRKVEE